MESPKIICDQAPNGVGIADRNGEQGGGIIEQIIDAEEPARRLAGLVWMRGVTAFAGVKVIERSAARTEPPSSLCALVVAKPPTARAAHV